MRHQEGSEVDRDVCDRRHGRPDLSDYGSCKMRLNSLRWKSYWRRHSEGPAPHFLVSIVLSKFRSRIKITHEMDWILVGKSSIVGCTCSCSGIMEQFLHGTCIWNSEARLGFQDAIPPHLGG